MRQHVGGGAAGILDGAFVHGGDEVRDGCLGGGERGDCAEDVVEGLIAELRTVGIVEVPLRPGAGAACSCGNDHRAGIEFTIFELECEQFDLVGAAVF